MNGKRCTEFHRNLTHSVVPGTWAGVTVTVISAAVIVDAVIGDVQVGNVISVDVVRFVERNG